MKSSISGESGRSSTGPIESRSALQHERVDSDDGIQEERQFLDDTLIAIEKDSRARDPEQSVFRALKNRIRLQRKRFDSKRSADRCATDDALRGERDAENQSAAQRLWLIVPEIDTIATAVNSIRLDTFDHPNQARIFGLSNEVEIALESVLDLIAAVLEPEERRTHGTSA